MASRLFLPESERARDQYAELLPIYDRVIGAEHPETLAVRGNLARWTREADRGGTSNRILTEPKRLVAPC